MKTTTNTSPRLSNVHQRCRRWRRHPMAINSSNNGRSPSAATATDYKAIVCIFLYGGNDYANTLVPHDSANYNAYQQLRPHWPINVALLTGTALAPIGSTTRSLRRKP